MNDTLFIGCDLDLHYSGAELQDGTDLTSGSCTTELFTEAGVTVSGPITLTRTGNDYDGVLESTYTILCTLDAIYYVSYTFVQGTVNDYRRVYYRAKYRGPV